MARLNRVCPAGIPQHIIQRGNNRQVCFADEQDFVAYAGWLKEYAEKYQVDIHAWVFMTNHVHLLCTPGIEHGISQMMQAVGRQYVRHFNKTYRRSGTLWEGRFKSCLVQAENYLLHLHRYIELNPVRAGMVKQPSDYFWSSYSTNAFGKPSALCQRHSLYMRLANSRKTDWKVIGNYSGIMLKENCWKKSEVPQTRAWLWEMRGSKKKSST